MMEQGIWLAAEEVPPHACKHYFQKLSTVTVQAIV
jgi:hypothetical protein